MAQSTIGVETVGHQSILASAAPDVKSTENRFSELSINVLSRYLVSTF